MMESTLRRTWAEIDLDALAHNYQTISGWMGESAGYVGVVKADAYGHGSVQVAKTLEEAGAAYLAVSNVEEARELRMAGIRLPILQLGVTPEDQTLLMIQNRITQTVYDEASAVAFSKAAMSTGEKLKVHIKLDTGMSRLGFSCDEEHFDASFKAICRVAGLPGLDIEGVFTHFAVSDEPSAEQREYTCVQHDGFEKMIAELKKHGIMFSLHHCANSGAVVFHRQYAHDLYRPGIITYGIGDGELGLKPVMSLKTMVGCIKEYHAGTTLGYGRTFMVEKTSRIGVLPIGYADGLHRILSNRWKVWTPFGTAPIVGRICMDMCMIDLTYLPQIEQGDEVEVFGPHNLVTEAAKLAETIPYELTCAVSKRVPRVYYKNKKEIGRELLLRG